MLQEFAAINNVDEGGLPAGGNVTALGLSIEWQKGPLKEGPSSDPNGAFVETVIMATVQRIRWYQEVSVGKFACHYNDDALAYLMNAMECLDARTKDRQRRGVEGTHQT